MIDVNLLRENTDDAKQRLVTKGLSPERVDDFLALDTRWRTMIQELDTKRALLNTYSRERNIEKAKEVKVVVKSQEEQIRLIEEERSALLTLFPNIPFRDVPVGESEQHNVVLREVGEKPQFSFVPKDYLTLGRELQLIDVERSAKVAGSRFGYLKNEAVLLEMGLIQHAFATLRAYGFQPILPPVMIRPAMLHAMGKTKFIEEHDAFFVAEDDLYLAGSSEHTIGPLYAGETLLEASLPQRFVGFSTCFRREAGSYGKDTKGILRVHQFDKVEMFSFAHPDHSEEEHQKLLGFQEALVSSLELPYRVVEICTGDMGFPDARQYDIETWIPSEQTYRETHSCSNTTDFQARGLHARYRGQDGETHFLHTLNATAFAIQRMLIALLENHQTENGGIRIPTVLQSYVGMKEINAPHTTI
ncbi:MAG: serine--tRNA ligase [Candidatus Harrisonbacteria bacterium CG10_big_fil_rev_8_21_14_0_10_42_17]|uniref:Serine--tRNA ligase n=1 Tax=Candidatus Harrisonbacteria bacterium CG10_big_fil_rev_8_21_14_0_10_42_17 TaxID=1974584 RepID=A0A2M6WHP0_9BACT|nr:MAG: serine--tRNA ligase [Candidatus Harrisonbacteria bacterium CG10_big_fil_rev_8_21_14_0_10_42_17]